MEHFEEKLVYVMVGIFIGVVTACNVIFQMLDYFGG